ncbi:MAG: DNA-binding response OmpR family regulator [Gammaproteobacteria bacterium]|jgi:DNA-binding response OmpR family regulator
MNSLEWLRTRAILIVDNTHLQRIILQCIFQSKKFNTIFLAASAKEAIAIINTKTVHLVLTDWYMPEESGLVLVKKIRAQDTVLPIIMVTGTSSKKNVLEAIEVGANDYIVKPVVPKDVIQKATNQLRAASSKA